MKKGFKPRQPNCNAYYQLLNRALQTIRRRKDIKEKRRQVEQLLESNLDNLEEFSTKFRGKWTILQHSLGNAYHSRSQS